MSQSPYVYDNKGTRQAFPTDPNTGSTVPGLSNYGQTGYVQYPQSTRPAQRPGSQHQGNPQPGSQHSPIQQSLATRSYPFTGSNSTYTQFDQNQQQVYYQPIQQYQQGAFQQQVGQPQQQPQQQQPQPQQLQTQTQQNQQQSQQQQLQQQQNTYNPVPSGPTTGTVANITQYPPQSGVGSYLSTGYPVTQLNYASPAPGAYGYAAYPTGIPVDQSHLAAPTSGSNINMANIRGPLQSATNPPLIDPNQIPQRPKLTTTFWEDEGTVCYQVESRGISVSRREDTNFINGTKLLNVARMTRGRRDGILKSEKVRYVVKIGAMNLKGVWIPFERALELARNEGIVDLLYPLFVKDIKELYQGPQYSGGLTAAANQNPKNIIPVTVTNTTYIPHVYASREKKKSVEASSTSQAGRQEASDSSNAQQGQAQALPPQVSYGYSSYPYSSGQENAPYMSQPQSQPLQDTSSQSLNHYKTGSYYGYQQPSSQINTTKLTSTDGAEKNADEEETKR